MDPVYLDLHIHTSEDPSHLNGSYDWTTLISKVKEKAQGAEFLISFTDHNTVNEKVYLDAAKKIGKNLILGVEIHIQTHRNEKTKAYHCHIYFNLEKTGITEEVVRDINSKLDVLYPNKAPMLTDQSIPLIQDIIEAFDEYDFMLLPHGGQTHATFDQAMPEGRQFDNAMQRSIYYNFFDGFTSRSDEKTEKTKKYLKKLGLEEFVNLITCTDNYDPKNYPKPRNEETYKFVPTWMYATPTFEGLRLSLSDSSRLEYSQTKPKRWRDSIKSIKLKNEKIDIDVQLTPGLNVIIGESSSGKTLFVDSLHRKIAGVSFENSIYNEYDVENIEINYPDKLHPHYIGQNYVMDITANDKQINNIEIIKKILPENKIARQKIDKGLKNLNQCLTELFDAVEKIENLEGEIKRIPVLSGLITSEEVHENVLKNFLDIISSIENAEYSESDERDDIEFLENLDERLTNNPFIKHDKKLIEALKEEIGVARDYATLEEDVRSIVEEKKEEIDDDLEDKVGEAQRKMHDFDLLIGKMKKYYRFLLKFESVLQMISEFSIEENSEKKVIQGHTLSIENKFKLNKEIIKNELNEVLLRDRAVLTFEDITPESLFSSNFRNNFKGTIKGGVRTYEQIRDVISGNLKENDEIKYKIITPEKRDFDDLSPGLKTAIILELILNFEDDRAPLIIDQPEDNLATSYMNEGLVRSIKKMKGKKQIIFVSHNATIPMSGDAQNIVLCKNNGDTIEIRSNPLEGKIDDTNVVDYIAKIADGGKPSIKKRFKKYNLRSFKE